jgi:hypothetical protein
MRVGAIYAAQVRQILASHVPPVQPMPDDIQIKIEAAIAWEAERRKR